MHTLHSFFAFHHDRGPTTSQNDIITFVSSNTGVTTAVTQVEVFIALEYVNGLFCLSEDDSPQSVE